MNNPLRINLFFLLFSYFCIVSLSALAQENVTEKITSLKKEGYNTYIESTGLYLQDHQSSLGNGLYHGAKRGQIASLIRGIQDQAQWAAQSTLIKRLLLTQADTSILENDIPFSEESDLLAIRLKALLALGLQNQAFRLYSELDNTNTHNALHYYGVLSMLMSGEKALACVEIKTLFPDYQDLEEWQKLNTYCAVSLSVPSESKPEEENEGTEEKDILTQISESTEFLFPYLPETFESLSLEDKAFLVAEKRLNFAGYDKNNYKTLPANHIQALLLAPHINNSQKILLYIRGAQTGVIAPEDLTVLYTKTAQGIKADKRQASNVEKIAVLYSEMGDTWLASSKIKFMGDIILYAKTHGVAALIPFLPMLQKIDPEDIQGGVEDIRLILLAAIIAHAEINTDWVISLSKMTVENEDEKKLLDRLIISSFLLSDPTKMSNKKRLAVVDVIEKSRTEISLTLKNIIENIDTQHSKHANVTQIYDNNELLETIKSYKMPSYMLTNAIKDASGKSMASVILLSNIVLTELSPADIYIGTVDFIARAMNKIGLTKEARNILAEYVLRAEER
tara:strand:+ start:8437 stop:10131 length:1695 start_codon:yes stop_codon:yes gene_type:complete